MGKYLLAASVAALSIAGVAQAQPATGSFYGKAFGGWTIPQNDDFDLETTDTGVSSGSGLDYDTGYVLGLAGGYQFTPNVAVELEYAYRNADADLKRMGTDGTLTSNAIMANAIYSFPGIGTNGAFRPYVGAGLGAADAKFDADSDLDADYGFAYQVMTGVAYDINPQWSLNGEVRYFGISDQEFEGGGQKFESSYQTFDVLVGVSYHF